MKTTEAKTTSAARNTKSKQLFFSKEGKGGFFGESIGKDDSFFKPSSAYAVNRNAVLQTRLTIGQPNDKYEQEADAMADKVVQRLSNPEPLTKKDSGIQAKPLLAGITPLVQSKCATCEPALSAGRQEERLEKKEEDELMQESPLELQRKPIFEGNADPPDENIIQRKCAECDREEKLQRKTASDQTENPDLESSLMASKGSGSSLPSSTREQMESSFGADFSGVRIHNDSSATQMNKDLHAQAFTHGSDIYFNSGKYDTNSSGGKHLLAHELTHVVQQNHFSKQGVVQKQDDPVPTDTASTAPLVQQPVPQTMTCVPVGLSRADFLSVNGNDVSEFGHTVISVSQTMLNPTMVTFQRVGRSRRVKPMPIVVNLPAIESFYTQAGIFYEGSQRVVFGPEDDCLTDTYSLQWRISTDGASKIRDGEQEHCDDYNYAYANSVLPFVAEVNRLASGSRTFGSERAGKRYLQRVIGFNPDDWFTRFSCLLRLSLQRDRVTRGFTRSSHDPIPFTNAPNRYNRCRHATVSITARSLPQVGQIGSAAIITGC